MSAVAEKPSLVSMDQYCSIAFRFAQIKDAKLHPEARKKTYIVTLGYHKGFNDIISCAQLPYNYPDAEKLKGKIVLTITNFATLVIAKVKSNALIVGFPDSDGHVHLLNTRGAKIDPGQTLAEGYDGKKKPKTIVYQSFEEIETLAATITKIAKIVKKDSDSEAEALSLEALSLKDAPAKDEAEAKVRDEEERKVSAELADYQVELDVGEKFGKRVTILPSLKVTTAAALINTQVAACINLEPPKKGRDILVLSVKTASGEQLPLGIDVPVANGVKLF